MSSAQSQQQVNDTRLKWFESPLGQYLQQEEQLLYDQAIVNFFGFDALQMGCPHMDLLRNSRIARHYKASDAQSSPHAVDLQCDDDFLPFADTCLDLLLLPHRLEFSERPHQTLREAERVVIPEGHLLISGFNPFSLWGLKQVLKNIISGRCSRRSFPWDGKFIGLSRLKDWLTLLGFEVVSVQTCCHIPPFEKKRWQRRFAFMNKLSPRWLPFIGGVYFIVAKKRVAAMTPLRPVWKTASIQSSLVAKPSQRKGTQCTVLEPQNKTHREQ